MIPNIMRETIPSPWEPLFLDIPSTIGRDEIQVFSLTLADGRNFYSQWLSILSPDERERARNMILQRDREVFVLTRASLRLILARLLDEAPEALTFGYGTNGKPYLRRGIGERTLWFNVSHSRERAVVAVSLAGPVGIDIEWMDPDIDFRGIAARFFSESESKALHRLPPDTALKAFYRCWTRKEACIKALGAGLKFDLASFDVSESAKEPIRWLDTGSRASTQNRWDGVSLEVFEDYSCALVAAKDSLNVRLWRFPP